jgi:hypothetical protein
MYTVAAPGDPRFLISDPPPPAIPSVVYVEHWFSEQLARTKE